ncbi:MAG TPA: OmpA family protein [Saprospiraceae bacterium]|nr:OmpA family protein [Saprospiraceae bacterium]HND88219.1 OmpA family protein [Saprospiraceae bacterium]
MGAKSLVLLAFGLWSFISWRWYVCGIKQACGTDRQIAPTEEVIQTPAIEPDTVATIDLSGSDEQAAAPADSRSNLGAAAPGTSSGTKSAAPAAASAPPKASKPMTSSIDEVQMENVEDRMVIYFPYSSVRREDNDAIDDYLNRLAQFLIASQRKVSITGHTDFVGEAKDNLRFGQLRAASIRDALVKRGVSKAQVSIHSLGESKSIATNDTPQGRYRNRRVEIRVK